MRARAEIVGAAVDQDGTALEFAGEQLRKDAPLVLRAVEGNGLALQFADGALQAQRSIVLAAVRSRGFATHAVLTVLNLENLSLKAGGCIR